jgi:CBS domain-containing protein
MYIRKTMTAQVITIDKYADILEARALMVANRFRHLPVVDENDNLAGIITDRDVRSALSLERYNAPQEIDPSNGISGIVVADVMTRDPLTIALDSTIQDALLLIRDHGVGAFPVVDETGKLRGILSDSDLLRAFINVLGINEPGVLLGIQVNEAGNAKDCRCSDSGRHLFWQHPGGPTLEKGQKGCLSVPAQPEYRRLKKPADAPGVRPAGPGGLAIWGVIEFQ